ncbi:MAG: DegT/DnrJ/EryC1/StrS family aminotransferase [Lachnospiraceae bacterium]
MKKAIQVTSASMPPKEEYEREIASIWENHWLTHTGPKHQQLEKELCSYLKVGHTALFSNGHMALEMALRVLGLKGEVITTPFTFASTTQAIMNVGLTPVFCDIEEEHYTLDASKIEALITDKTCAILPVHVYGSVCDYKKIEEIAKKHNLKVIYDAAHAFGVLADGTGVGELGDISMFSFHATKVFNTIEGGGLTFSDGKLSKELAALRQFGMYGKEDAEMLGTNAKMTEFQAAMGLCNLRHIEAYIEKRKQCVERYWERLDGLKGIRLWREQEGVKANYAYFPVVFEKAICGISRDEVCEALAKEDIFARKYFYPITSEFTICKKLYPIQPTPIAKRISEQVVTLPLYSDLQLEEVDRICDVIIKLLEEK